MTVLPTGTVTFLFTDLWGSTRLWAGQPAATEAVLADAAGDARSLVNDAASAQHLYDTLTSSASYQSAGCQTTSQSLLIKFSNGVTLQLAVSGEKVMACGTWACPDFFAVFTEAL